jgi:soluble lytic murein transglycosylase
MRMGGTPQRATRSAIAVLLVAGALATPAAVRGPSSNEVQQLAHARESLDQDDAKKALKRLNELDGGALGDHVGLLRTRVLRGMDKAVAAIAAAEAGLALDPPSELRARLHEQIAGIQIERGELLDAYKAQRRAWEASRDPEYSAALVTQLARAFEQAGLPGDALNLYRRVWTDWPVADVSTEAFERSDQLTRGTGARPPAAYALLQRANRLRERYRCSTALDLYERVLARSDELEASARRSAQNGRAACLFSVRRYDEAAEAYRAIDAERDDFEAALKVARAYARSGRSDKALTELAKRRKRAKPAGRARCDDLSAIVVRTSQPTRYLELMRSVAKQSAAPGLAKLARWRLTWIDLASGQHDRAVPRLQKLARGAVHDIEVQRARYWLAIARRATDAEAAEQELRKLAEAAPLSYYGMIAANHLAAPPDPVRPFLGQRKPEPVHTRATRAGWLLDAGLDELAGYELLSWLWDGKLNRQHRLQAASLLHEVGDHFRAVRTVINGFGSALDEGIDPDWIEAWQLAWPQAFEGHVRAAIAEFGFDQTLVWAVMREESTYRPTVSSPAGAIGLMQIIPPTGERIASSLGVAGFVPEKLQIPDLNIRFGTYYLNSLVSRFEGSQALAVAAYNAGPEAVNRWLRQDGRQANDAFVESIPYGETRRYLRRVLRSQRVYRLLYPQPRPDQAAPASGSTRER